MLPFFLYLTVIPSLKLTARPWKCMVGRWSFPLGAKGLFSGAFAVSFREAKSWKWLHLPTLIPYKIKPTEIHVGKYTIPGSYGEALSPPQVGSSLPGFRSQSRLGCVGQRRPSGGGVEGQHLEGLPFLIPKINKKVLIYINVKGCLCGEKWRNIMEYSSMWCHVNMFLWRLVLNF